MFNLPRNYPQFATELNDRVSEAAKLAKDGDWAKRKIDYYDIYKNYSGLFNDNFKKLKDNYDIVNGKYDVNNLSYVTNPYFLKGDLKFKLAELRNYNIIAQVVNASIGEEMTKPLLLNAFSTNDESISLKKQIRADLIREYIDTMTRAYIDEQLATAAQKQGLEPNTEEYYQFIEQNAVSMTPREIENYMSRGFRLPDELQAQHILNYEKHNNKFKEKFSLGWRHVQSSAKEVYWTGIENDKPVLRIVNPLFFTHGGSRDSDNIEDGHWACYTEYLTKEEIAQRYSQFLKEKDWKLLDEQYNSWHGQQDWIYPIHHGMINWEFFHNIDDPYQFFENGYIRVVHVAWKSLKKVKDVVTQNPETGEIEEYTVDETYVKNPDLDLSVKIRWIPEVWQGYKIEAKEPIYFDIRPLPYSEKLPYCGFVYDATNSQAISPVERGMVWQEIYNIVMYYFEKALATDFGKIAFMNLHNKTDDLSIAEFMHFMTQGKFGFLDMGKKGTNPAIDAQVLRAVDMSNINEISKYMEILAYIEAKCKEAMFYNDNRLGNAQQYESVTNNQQNIIQSSHQTQPYYSQHNKVKEAVATMFLEYARIAYQNNPESITYSVDDNTVTSLQLDAELLELSRYGVFISNDPEQFQKTQILKNSLKEIIQNTGGDLRILGDIVTMDSPAQIKQQLYKYHEERMQQEQDAAKRQEDLQRQAIQAQQEAKQLEMEYNANENQLDRENQYAMAELNAMMLANQHDIDSNKENDAIEKERVKAEEQRKTLKLQAKLDSSEKDKDRRQETKENSKDRILKNKEIQVKKAQAAKKPTK